MSQHDMDIATADANSGPSMRAAINAALQALASNNSGTTAPTTTYAYMWWADVTTGKLWQRNAANSGWIDKGLIATAETAWVNATLVNSWVTDVEPLKYKKLSNGLIILNGAIKNGTYSAGTVLCTLPAGYRPGAKITFNVGDKYGPYTGRVSISTAGVITADNILSATAVFYTTFFAEN